MCKMKFKRLTDAKRLVLFTEEDTQEMNDDEKKRMKDNLASIDEDSVTFMNENGKEEKPVMMKDMSSEELLMIVGWIDSMEESIERGEGYIEGEGDVQQFIHI